MVNLPDCRELEDFASSDACWHPRNTYLRDSSLLGDVAVIAHRVKFRNYRRRKFEDSRNTTVTVQSRTNAADYRQVNEMAGCKASNELGWLQAWRACAHPSVRPAGSVAMVNCTLLDRSDRSSKAAGWTLGRDSWLHSFGA